MIYGLSELLEYWRVRVMLVDPVIVNSSRIGDTLISMRSPLAADTVLMNPKIIEKLIRNAERKVMFFIWEGE
jgi:hypothetical protein